MAQNYDAPAFQEYAANMLSDINFRRMPLEARGLLFTLRLECWPNKMPSDPAELAEVLRVPEEVVRTNWKYLAPFFYENDGVLYCKYLEKYRADMLNRREAQVRGGKMSAENKKRRRSGEVIPAEVEGLGKATTLGTSKVPTSNLQGSSKHAASSHQVLSLDQSRVDQAGPGRRNEYTYEDISPEDNSGANHYSRLSNGE